MLQIPINRIFILSSKFHWEEAANVAPEGYRYQYLGPSENAACITGSLRAAH